MQKNENSATLLTESRPMTIAQMQSTMNENGYLTTREAAELLGVSLRTVQLWVESAVLRAWKTAGGHRRIERSSVQELLDQRGTAAGGQESAVEDDRLTVVYVEDDAKMVKFFKRLLDTLDLSMRVITAANGFDGLLQIGLARPDLIMTDLLMPGMDGFRMIRAIKGQPEMAKTRLVVITGLSDDDLVRYGGLPEGVQVLHKPVSIDQIKALLRTAVDEKRGG